MIRIGIVGATGYTGVELLRLLLAHPEVEIVTVTSRTQTHKRLTDQFPHLAGRLDLVYEPIDIARLKECALVFFATPNGVAMELAPSLLDAGVRVIDLGADFRLRDSVQWQTWYGMPHACPEILEQAVYGLPELHRSRIARAQLVANPGCYPTAVALGLLPLIEAGVVDSSPLIADAKSGVSGAGRNAKLDLLFSEVAGNFRAYGVFAHRHQPEICQTLNDAGANNAEVIFVPHLVPMIRGIHATLYATLRGMDIDVQSLYVDRYRAEPFVKVLDAGGYPETRHVSGVNECRIAVHQSADRVIVLSVIDNLVKGAAGQAIQNMNLMFGMDEALGLKGLAVIP